MVTDFVKHLFPRVVLEKYLQLSYTFCLGGLTFSAFLVMLLSGMLLLVYYQPTPERAFTSIIYLESAVWGGKYIRSLHRLTSHVLLILLLLHTLRVILTGAYQRPREMNWVIGMLLLLLCVFEAYTGYLLPMDQLAYWATQTGMELLLTAPFGGAVRSLLVPDGVGQPLSLLRFYALHIVVVPLSVLLLSMLHFYRVRKNKGVLPYL
jgi:quinol-cytochrome oxidoreductase complex cytochrome b subunit